MIVSPTVQSTVLSHFHDGEYRPSQSLYSQRNHSGCTVLSSIDHFDAHVQKNLDKNIPILTTPQAVNELAKLGFLALFPLQTYERALLVKGDAKIAVTSMPAQVSFSNLLPSGT